MRSFCGDGGQSAEHRTWYKKNSPPASASGSPGLWESEAVPGQPGEPDGKLLQKTDRSPPPLAGGKPEFEAVQSVAENDAKLLPILQQKNKQQGPE